MVKRQVSFKKWPEGATVIPGLFITPEYTSVFPSELIDQAYRNNIIGIDVGIACKLVVFQQVDFIIHIGGHIFVEVSDFLSGLFMASFHWWRRKVNRLPPWDDV